jgi:pyruvate, water dikinase
VGFSVNQYTSNFNEISSADLPRVGGKCASLGQMTKAGVAVPPGFAVTTDAYRLMLDQHALGAEIARHLADLDVEDSDALERTAQAIRKRMGSHPMPQDVESAIRAAYSALGNYPVAVRSSATAEDLPDASFAGQQDTYLWITGIDQVLDKVRDCWASLYTARAIAYRAKNKISHADVLMSVGVQKMVKAKAAGVAMTLDPATGDRTRIVIDASWGLGEMVVSGLVTPDNFVVEKVLEQILTRTISDKHIELVGDAKAGCAMEREVDRARRMASSLNDSEVLAVAKLAKRLEKLNKCPQDVEWAFDADLPEGENLLALQARPETVWSLKKKDEPKQDFAVGLMSIVNTLSNPVAYKKTEKRS